MAKSEHIFCKDFLKTCNKASFKSIEEENYYIFLKNEKLVFNLEFSNIFVTFWPFAFTSFFSLLHHRSPSLPGLL